MIEPPAFNSVPIGGFARQLHGAVAEQLAILAIQDVRVDGQRARSSLLHGAAGIAELCGGEGQVAVAGDLACPAVVQ
ncbi:hypothetical protein G6F24_016963 [Rhizopus arrhizus]|nr:hypothetical protein G6F24_016963 [Rhizopus arrhizus]